MLDFFIEKADCAFKYKTRTLYPGYSDIAKSYDELKFVHIISGSGIWNIGGEDFYIRKDDILAFSRVDERYIKKINSGEPLRIEYVEFLPTTLHPMQSCADFFFHRSSKFSNVLDRDNDNHNHLLLSFERLQNELCEERAFQNEYIVHLLIGMTIAAARIAKASNTNEKNDDRYTIICRIMTHIKNNPSADFSRERLSREYGLTPSYLSRIFHEYSGECLQDYIMECRVQKAIFLMKSENYQIIDAAYESGFQSISGFYKAFRKVTGKTPKEAIK